MFKCCLCGKSYETERAAVRCVNQCGREKFLNGDFKTKTSTYLGETTKISYFNIKEDNLKDKCKILLCQIKAKGVLISLRRQFNNWDKLSKEEQIQFYEILKLKI